jgi:signal transduction histidine kinase/DNA-binding response OmpR family regulator
MSAAPRFTIGVLAGWQYYWTPTALSYLSPIFRGIRQAAAAWDCNLLLACGMGSSASVVDPMRPAWPVRSPDSDFVPVGPWNTDGTIVVNPLHTQARSSDVQAMIRAGHPVVFIAAGESGPTIEADNRSGIREAVLHLFGHGHQDIAFIAGSPEDLAGDTGERLAAYHSTLVELGLHADERRLAYGRHTYAGGLSAMRQILSTRLPFTSIVASNDESALGALQALAEAGLKVPEDIAIVGFDDRPESALQRPSLSSVAVPLAELGVQAVHQLVRLMRGEPRPARPVRVPTRLVPRESCGCAELASSAQLRPELDDERARLIAAFEYSLELNDPAPLTSELTGWLDRDAPSDDDNEIWRIAFDAAWRVLPALADGSDSARAEARNLVARAQLALLESMTRRRARSAMNQRWTFDRLGLLTARLLNARDEERVYDVLAQHLPEMGVGFAVVATFQPAGDDPVGSSLLRVLAPGGQPSSVFPTRQFPPAGLLPPGQPYSLALLPVVNPRGQLGFAAFDTAQLDLYGSITQELAAALHAAALYEEAQEGRRLAEEAARMKSRFLSTVSHELRTPLNLIMGLSEILLRDESPAVSSSAHYDLERLHANAQHLSRLISDVLDLASSDAGRLRLTYHYVDLGQVLWELSETGRRLATDKGLNWSADLPASGPWVWGDRTRLSQVALNLVSNAIKFTQRGEVRIAVESSEQFVTVSVVDTGLGIPLADQATVFDEFRRSGRSIERGYSGLGLGLSICKRLVELHGGMIGVESTGQEGAGSRFYFTLPFIDSPAQLAAHGARDPSANALVLVLAASASTNERLREHLGRRGYEVQVAQIDEPSTWQAHIFASLPSAIVLDVSIASEQGWRALKALKANPVTSNIPVLFYAVAAEGAASGEAAATSAALLEFDYLTKPIELANLARALDQHWLAPSPELAVRKFLIVDDDPDTLEMHARIVQGSSPANHVFRARNGLEALRVLSEEQIDLVLLDLMMPEMDGFEVLEAMRERPATRDIPVIVVTGQTLSEPEMARLNLGVTKVLSKGVFSMEETLSHLEAALERRRELSGEARRLVRQAMAYMHDHYAEPLSREEIAVHVGLSQDYLTSCFHKELGLTPVAYLNRYRVQQARLLLKRTHKSVTEIALEVGFSGSSYFSRIFHRETGMSPADFRRA